LSLVCHYSVFAGCFAMPVKPEFRTVDQNEAVNTDRSSPSLTDRLNKYLLCAYLNRLNEEDRCGDGDPTDVREERRVVVNDDIDTEQTFYD